MNKQKILLLLGIFLLLVGSGALYYLSLPYKNYWSAFNNPSCQVEPLPQLGKSFTLLDHNNKLRSKDEFKGKIVLIYFGYTFCPDICPTTLYNITDALNALGPKAQFIQTLFVTVDPQRDNQKHIRDFLSHFHPSIIGLTGTESEINQVIQDYKVYAHKIIPQGSSIDYLIDHSSIVYIYDRAGNFINSFNDKTPADEIVKILTPYL